jgi:hypothetical protein
MSKIRIYLSHPIRGIKGADATHQDLLDNNEKAHQFARRVRNLFPEIDLYVPGEHDEFVIHAFETRMLSEAQILEIDKMIIDDCDGILYYNFEGEMSGGMVVEYEHAVATNTPGAEVRDLSDTSAGTGILIGTVEVLLEDIDEARTIE